MHVGLQGSWYQADLWGGAGRARIIFLFQDKPWQPGCGGERVREQSQEETEALLVRRRVLGV